MQLSINLVFYSTFLEFNKNQSKIVNAIDVDLIAIFRLGKVVNAIDIESMSFLPG